MLPTLRADIALYEDYRHEPGPRLHCTLAAFGGDRDPLVSTSDLGAWQALAGAGFATRQFAGDHFFLQQDTSRTVAAVRSILDVHL
jgi:surfactin synthase thioesterase subunit